jgi:alpha-glucosidase (family GH31 glycosyl hydrolase)
LLASSQRWYNFDAWDLDSIVEEFDAHDLPLDVMILDMNFHAKPGWTGYSFDRSLFPVRGRELQGLRRRGVHVGVNIHDAEGEITRGCISIRPGIQNTLLWVT